MKLLPRELDKLILIQAGQLAQRRLARGLQLNHTEATALICTVLLEHCRDGRLSLTEIASQGRELLGTRLVLPQAAATLDHVSFEATLPDGTKLITVHNPIASLNGNLEACLYGSFLPIPLIDSFPEVGDDLIPGEVVVKADLIHLNVGRKRICLTVTNNGDRPIQVGSHYHFLETNGMLLFDREASYGYRLDLPAGTAMRFEPGETRLASLVELGGNRVISGGNNLASGLVDPQNIPSIMQRVIREGFQHQKEAKPLKALLPFTMDRRRYAAAYGPTVGDKVRLGDTKLFLEIEKDFTTYGDECVFGGGKVLREGMGQANGVLDSLDLVITNVIIIDHSGIFKADIGIKRGYIVGIGKAGNPDVMDGVTPGMTIGVTTEVLAGENKIVTAGAVDSHVHFICPQLCLEALASGTTTLIGGGTGPNTGTNATTCTPGAHHIKAMLLATDSLPLNFGFTGKGNSSSSLGLVEQIEAGAVGLKLHEDWGSTPAAINKCLEVCEKFDVQATMHTDTLNESGFVEKTVEATKGRTIHAYHGLEVAVALISLRFVDSKTSFQALQIQVQNRLKVARPFTKNTLDEHLDMLMVCHHLSRDIPEDIAFAESRIRGETIGAEDVLQDIGAISIISSDSQAMGRVGEVISRTWQTASKMKSVDQPNDNVRIKRYVSKYTINPAIAHGISHVVGSVEVGKLADLVLYSPAFFGTKPDLILKGGLIAQCQMGDPNASIPTPQPVYSRPMFGALPSVLALNCLTFISKVSNEKVMTYKLRKKLVPVVNCRNISKKDMKWNSLCPDISVDPETYQVKVDNKVIFMEPSDTVPIAQSVFLI